MLTLRAAAHTSPAMLLYRTASLRLPAVVGLFIALYARNHVLPALQPTMQSYTASNRRQRCRDS